MSHKHTMNTSPLLDAIIHAGDYLRMLYGIETHTDALKTVEYFQRTIERDTRLLYRGEIGQAEFENRLVDLLDQQLDRAWNEGMRANGLDPKQDMIPEYEDRLEEIKLSELDHVPDFSEAIVDAAQRDTENETPGASLQGLYVRGSLWSNRYTEVVNESIQMTAPQKQKLVWRYGDTVDHCDQCLALDGVVATAEEWQESGIRPQHPPNDMLECGGWRCQCTLMPTGDPLTPERLEIFASIAG